MSEVRYIPEDVQDALDEHGLYVTRPAIGNLCIAINHGEGHREFMTPDEAQSKAEALTLAVNAYERGEISR